MDLGKLAIFPTTILEQEVNVELLGVYPRWNDTVQNHSRPTSFGNNS